MTTILGRPLSEWQASFPLLEPLRQYQEVFWLNPQRGAGPHALAQLPLTLRDVQDAEARLQRFAPYLQQVFPETAPNGGLIESEVQTLPEMQRFLSEATGLDLPGQLLLKGDHALPIAGSIKARGGIYEVLKHAEGLALEHGLLRESDDYQILAEPRLRELFSRYAIAVGSTGNLGLSIGIISAQLGFRVTVHMSADAKAWKKALLREKGVEVIEYPSDYSVAVAQGREQAQLDPRMHFVDDENSRSLFLGYAVAGLRLKRQLAEKQIVVDAGHPLFVYLPCGVGGGPGGVAFGLKLAFGDAVHCFFAEPTHSPCLLLGMMTGLHDRVSVQDFGLDNRTAADGLAVGRPSSFVGQMMTPLLSGIFTVSDDQLFQLLRALQEREGLLLEPSALAGMPGPPQMLGSPAGQAYLQQNGLSVSLDKATQLIWATGGSMVPPAEAQANVRRGRELGGWRFRPAVPGEPGSGAAPAAPR